MNGYLRIASIMPKIKLGNVQFNLECIKREVLNAIAVNAKICILPKLSLTGIGLKDLFKDKNLLNYCTKALLEMKYFSQDKDVLIVLPMPLLYDNNIFEVACVIKSGSILGIVPNTNFSHDCYFCNSSIDTIFELIDKDHNEVLNIPFSDKIVFLYNSCNFTIAFDNNIKNKNSVIVNISAINETVYIDENIKFLRDISKKHNSTIIVTSPGPSESADNFVYFGRSMVIEDGEIISKNDIISNYILISDIDLDKFNYNNNFIDYKKINFNFNNYIHNTVDEKLYREFDKTPYINKKISPYNYSMHIINILSIALAKRMEAIKVKDIVIGISGGLDSTIALLVAKKTCEFLSLTNDNIHAISMPGLGTTDNANNNIADLVSSLSIKFNIVDIKNATINHFNDIYHDSNNTNVTYENAQARERMQILMDIANDINGIVVGTSDLSEIALGFSTYNGDHMSMYNVNGSLYKTLIRYIIDAIANENISKNPNLTNVLKNILHTPISPELKPTENGVLLQKTEDFLGAYEIHDFILYHYLKYHYDINKIYDLATRTFNQHGNGKYSQEYVKNCVNIFFDRFYKAQYKRSTAPDSPDIGLPNLSKKFNIPNDVEINVIL